jgi:hypothetical protein
LHGNVLIYEHKQHELAMQQRFPARALRDDRRQAADPRRYEAGLGNRLTTVFVRQGQYAASAPADLQPQHRPQDRVHRRSARA